MVGSFQRLENLNQKTGTSLLPPLVTGFQPAPAPSSPPTAPAVNPSIKFKNQRIQNKSNTTIRN